MNSWLLEYIAVWEGVILVSKEDKLASLLAEAQSFLDKV